VDDLEAKLRAQGLDPGSWGNGPDDRYAPHEHGYDKVLVCVAGSIRFGLPASGRHVDLAAGDRLDLPAGTRHDALVGVSGGHLPRGAPAGRQPRGDPAVRGRYLVAGGRPGVRIVGMASGQAGRLPIRACAPCPGATR
jgi:hypothetical protein